MDRNVRLFRSACLVSASLVLGPANVRERNDPTYYTSIHAAVEWMLLAARFPILLSGLVEALLRGDDFPPSSFPPSSSSFPPAPAPAAAPAAAAASVNGNNSSSSKNDDGDEIMDDDGHANVTNPDRGSDGGGGGGANGTGSAAIDRLLDASSCHGSGVEVSWKELAAPAARVWGACRPCDPTELRALDAILDDIFRVRL